MKEYAHEIGWFIPRVGITNMCLDPQDSNSECINILTSHRKLALDKMHAFKATRIDSKLRPAQDAHAMCRCVMNSTSKLAIK